MRKPKPNMILGSRGDILASSYRAAFRYNACTPQRVCSVFRYCRPDKMASTIDSLNRASELKIQLLWTNQKLYCKICTTITNHWFTDFNIL